MSSAPAQPVTEPADEPPHASTSPMSAVARRGPRRWLTFSLPGAWVAIVFACLSFTPSLLPRSGVMQGIVTGLSGAIGYGLGVAGAWVWREFADRGPRAPRPQSWRVFAVAAPVLLLVAVILGERWQNLAVVSVGHDVIDRSHRRDASPLHEQGIVSHVTRSKRPGAIPTRLARPCSPPMIPRAA